MFLTQRLLTSQRLLHRTVSTLYRTAQLTRPARSGRTGSLLLRRVVHVSPCFFSDRSYIGGGERYAMSLAEAIARHVETVFVSFGARRQSFTQGRLRVEIYPALKLMNGVKFDPLSYGFLRELVKADVLHCHQYKTVATNLAILAAATLRKRVFVTDEGGAACHFTDEIPLADFVDCFLAISAFAAKMLPPVECTRVIYGGVGENFLSENGPVERERKALFVGRLLPHKGINYLIEGIDEENPLEVIGRAYAEDYFRLLQQLAVSKRVRFQTSATDEDLVKAYRSALVTVLPSVYVDVYGHRHTVPELLGLVLLESMACGTPVICTDVGAMPEFVIDGETGFIVPPNDPGALRERIAYLLNNPEVALRMGQKGRERVRANFTWEAVALSCLNIYRQLPEN